MQTSQNTTAGWVEPRSTRWAWTICWLMFASTSLNYMDRQTVSLVRPQLRQAFAITSDAEFGWVLSTFIMVYALFQVPAGYLIDRLDLGWSYAFAVGWWSLAAMATAFAPTLGVLIACRALLGVGESFNWPCALKVTGRILPPESRALGNGIFNSGAAVGAVLTPLVVTKLAEWSSWKAAFVVIGATGFVWVGIWLLLIRGPERPLLRPRESPGELGRIQLSAPPAGYLVVLAVAFGLGLSSFRLGLLGCWLAIAALVVGPLAAALVTPLDSGLDLWARCLGEVARLRSFWLVALASISINMCWHFLINWVPTVLKEDQGFDYQSSNYLSIVPFLMADMGNLGGGWLSRRLAVGGWSIVGSRMLVLASATACALVGPWVGLARDQTLAVVLIAVTAMGVAAFMAVYFSFAQEVSSEYAGLVVGYLGALGNLAVAGFQPLAGGIKDLTGSFGPVFVLVGLLPLVSLGALAAAARAKPAQSG